MILSRTLALASAATLAASLLITGCTSSTPSAAASSGTPATATPMGMPAPQTSAQGRPPVPAAPPKPPTASLTHMMTKDEPYFDSQPGADAKSLGTLSKGTKLLLLVPAVPYSKVLTEDGATVYVMTDGLDPIPAKK